MKKLFKLLTIAFIGSLAFTSCKDNDFDFEAEKQANLKAEKKLDSLFSAEKIKIEKYVSEKFTTPIEDTVKYHYQYLNKSIKRGLWYEVITQPTDDSFNYTVQSNGYYFVPKLPKVKLKYSTKLLDGTLVQEDAEGTMYDLQIMSSGINSIYNDAWTISFIPYSIKNNGSTLALGGLTDKGLKKGSKIRVITPSPWAFYNRTIEKNANNQNIKDKIPAYSPLVYEFEVLSIEY